MGEVITKYIIDGKTYNFKELKSNNTSIENIINNSQFVELKNLVSKNTCNNHEEDGLYSIITFNQDINQISFTMCCDKSPLISSKSIQMGDSE